MMALPWIVPWVMSWLNHWLPTWALRLLGWLVLVMVLFGLGWFKGTHHVQAKWDAAIKLQSQQTAAERESQVQSSIQVVTRYVDRTRVVRERGNTIIQEVPIYVSQEADQFCTINHGFVRLHDTAAANQLPTASRDTDATAAELALSTVADTVARNYQTCHENAEQLKALQEWVREMQSTSKSTTRTKDDE
jgi:predicted membrane metal-binding protein